MGGPLPPQSMNGSVHVKKNKNQTGRVVMSISLIRHDIAQPRVNCLSGRELAISMKKWHVYQKTTHQYFSILYNKKTNSLHTVRFFITIKDFG